MFKIINKYKTFLKYISVSVLSFLIDILFFNIFNFTFKNFVSRIIISTILARIISSLFNYFCNKNKVFNNGDNYKKTILKYYLLVVIQMLVSAFLVHFIYKRLQINENFIKIPVEFLIFITNYFIQKKIIFKKEEK